MTRAGAVGAVVELDALGEPPQHLVARLALDLRDVRLLDPVARMGEPVGERAVVREEQHAGRVAVEASDGHDADVAADEIDDGRPALRVARGRDRPARLVEQDVAQRLLADLAGRRPRRRRRARRTCSARPGAPSTVTRPALISSSAPRREATPARAR